MSAAAGEFQPALCTRDLRAGVEESCVQEGTPAIFTAFKSYRDARLLRVMEGDDLYFAALYRHAVALTPLGRLYWRLAKQGRI